MPPAVAIASLAGAAAVLAWRLTLQTGSLFFLLAFGMIVRWRASMFLEYRALVAGASGGG